MKQKVLILTAMAGMSLLTTSSDAAVLFNEVLGSTTGTDSEFIELYNDGPFAVDLSNWSIELYDSDSGAQFGGLDGGSPFVIGSGIINAGEHFLLGNTQFANVYGITPDASLPANAIENSSYTMVLKNASGIVQETIFVWDGGASDQANIAGTPIAADFTIGPDGTNLPAGFYRVGDGSNQFALLEFDPQPAPSATPGFQNIPEPSTYALLMLGGMAFWMARKRDQK